MDANEVAKDKMNKTIAVLKRELSTLRAGRANAQVLDRVFVDTMALKRP